MAKLNTRKNSGGNSAAIDVDGQHVGGIELTGKGKYTADTKGRVPPIDGINGPSIKEVHDGIASRIAKGGVTLIKP